MLYRLLRIVSCWLRDLEPTLMHKFTLIFTRICCCISTRRGQELISITSPYSIPRKLTSWFVKKKIYIYKRKEYIYLSLPPTQTQNTNIMICTEKKKKLSKKRKGTEKILGCKEKLLVAGYTLRNRIAVMQRRVRKEMWHPFPTNPAHARTAVSLMVGTPLVEVAAAAAVAGVFCNVLQPVSPWLSDVTASEAQEPPLLLGWLLWTCCSAAAGQCVDDRWQGTLGCSPCSLFKGRGFPHEWLSELRHPFQQSAVDSVRLWQPPESWSALYALLFGSRNDDALLSFQNVCHCWAAWLLVVKLTSSLGRCFGVPSWAQSTLETWLTLLWRATFLLVSRWNSGLCGLSSCEVDGRRAVSRDVHGASSRSQEAPWRLLTAHAGGGHLIVKKPVRPLRPSFS